MTISVHVLHLTMERTAHRVTQSQMPVCLHHVSTRGYVQIHFQMATSAHAELPIMEGIVKGLSLLLRLFIFVQGTK